MADLPAVRITITNIASANGAATLQVLSGTLPYQTTIVTCSLTAAQNAAMQTALQATAGTSTNFDFAASPTPILGMANAL